MLNINCVFVCAIVIFFVACDTVKCEVDRTRHTKKGVVLRAHVRLALQKSALTTYKIFFVKIKNAF